MLVHVSIGIGIGIGIVSVSVSILVVSVWVLVSVSVSVSVLGIGIAMDSFLQSFYCLKQTGTDRQASKPAYWEAKPPKILKWQELQKIFTFK